MTVFVIMITPEASDSRLHPRVYKTLQAAKDAIRDSYGAPEERSDYVYRDKDYTYYKIVPILLEEGTK